jgi:hypothetical protein
MKQLNYKMIATDFLILIGLIWFLYITGLYKVSTILMFSFVGLGYLFITVRDLGRTYFEV